MTLTARPKLAFILVALAALALAALGLALIVAPVGADGDHTGDGLYHAHIKPQAGYKYQLDVPPHAGLDTEVPVHHHHPASQSHTFAGAHTMIDDPDYARPTPKISPDENAEWTSLTVPVEVDFGVNMTGFTADDITVRGFGNPTIVDFAPGATGVYTFDITTESDSLIAIILPANVAQTDVGVGNIAVTRTFRVRTSTATDLDVIIRCVVRPALNEIDVCIRFTDSVDDFVLSDITRSAEGFPASSLDYDLTGSGSEYVLNIKVPGTQSGALNVKVPANVATTASGVGNTESDTRRVPIDIVAPTVSSISLHTSDSLRFVFSEPVTDFVEDDITQSGTGSFTVTGMSSSTSRATSRATNFTAYIQVTRAGSVTVGVREGAVRDRAWHTNADAFEEDLTVAVGGM